MPSCDELQRLIATCAIDDGTRDPRVILFSVQQLTSCCTHETIRAVLDCRCPPCLEQSNSLEHILPSHIAANRIIGDADTPTLLVTFCLLVYIRCPAFIHNCLLRQDLLNDSSIGNRHDFSEADLHRSIWGSYTSVDSRRADGFAKQFWWNRRQFFVPVFKDCEFETYEKHDLLPFVDEQPIYATDENGEEIQDHGAFGRVFSFRIIPEYNGLSERSNNPFYVRKELFHASELRFHAEQKNLQLIKRLNDPHLVKLLKSYRHGNTFNFIFERAKTNLGCYLRESRYGASSARSIPAELNPLWTQALGIAKALSHVINYMPPSDGQPGRPLHGYHFDLKPANVLVDYDGTLLISDFGQARFQQIGDTSRITPVGGTEAYAPPEIDTHADKFNRKYDVWSLGCMFLEICVFVFAGHQGVRALDKARLTRRGNVMDDRFFIRVSGGTHEVKPEIRYFIENLRRPKSVRTSRSNEFLLEILALIAHMLEPNISRRMTAQEVCHKLESITTRYQPSSNSVHSSQMQQITLRRGDSEYAPHITKSLRTMMYYHNNRWLSGGLRIVEDDAHDINFLSSTDSTQVRINIGSRASVKVVPRFASYSRSPEEFLDCHMYFLNSGPEPDMDRFSATRLHFRDPAECSLAYSVFIGQDILSSSRIVQCTINKQESLRRRLSRHDSGMNTDVPSTVELWSENSHLHPISPSRSHPYRSVRHTTFSEPTHRRIVVYFEKSILLIRFAKNVRIKHPSKDDAPHMVTLIPTEPNRDPTFTVSLLKEQTGAAAAVPVSPTHLEQEEDAQKFECKSIEICFEHDRDRRTFFW